MRTRSQISEFFSQASKLEGARRFVFLGIGGAGMSGLAVVMKASGLEVAGVDQKLSSVTDWLQESGSKVYTDERDVSGAGFDVVVVSDAIDLDKSFVVSVARERGLPVVRRSQALGWFFRMHKVIAVTGTHGKSTTSAMLAHILEQTGCDPSYVVGANTTEGAPVARLGKSEYAVLESCEAYGGLEDITPYAVIVTNLELDHVDFYGSLEALEHEVRRFVERVDRAGFVILPNTLESTLSAQVKHSKVMGLVGDEWKLLNAPKSLGVAGKHNEQNAFAALTAWRMLGGDDEPGLNALSRFRGISRRMETIFEGQSPKGFVTVIDDYAHHPTEIAATLRAVREAHPGRRLVAAFQPHLYSRTDGAYASFASSLDLADVAYVTDIYPAREDPIPGVSSFRIVELMEIPTRYVPSSLLLHREMASDVLDRDVVVFLGAGDITQRAREFVQEMCRDRVRKVVVAFGGDSPEREVSIHSSLSAEAALQGIYEVTRVDFSETMLKSGDLGILTGEGRPDVVLLAVHGTHAEDGAIQGMLELAHIPYTGSGIMASALCVDKNATKSVLAREGLPVPQGAVVHRSSTIPSFSYPVVVKPNSQGSTVGMSFVTVESDYLPAVQKALAYDHTVLIEEYLVGREVTVPVLGSKALPVIEIKPKVGNYDFANKYTPGNTDKVCPADFSAEMTEHLQDLALRAHQAMGCEGLTRVDMIVTDRGPVILEINTLPGMTKTSLVSMSAKVAGIEFPEMLVWLVEDAYSRAKRK